jgi:dipeptidyl aminopeptidase/acylaminoacyl peptidase
MHWIRVFLALALAASLGSRVLAAPLEAYGKLPSVDTVSVSPSGHAVAIVVTNGEERVIVVKELASGQVTLRGYTGDVKVRGVQWADDEHLLIVSSATFNVFDLVNGYREWFYGSVVDLKTKKLRSLMRNADAAMAAIFDTPIVRKYGGEPKVYAQGMYVSGGRGRLSLYRIDLDNGVNRLVETGAEDTVDWVVGTNGEAVAQEFYNSGTGHWSLKLKIGGGWREVASATALNDRPYVMGLGRDGASVMYAMRENGVWSWREAHLDGRPTSGATPIPPLQSPIRDRQDGRLIGFYTLDGDEERYDFFNPEDARAWKAVTNAFPGDRVSLESWSNDHSKIAVRVDSPTQGPAYAIVDLATRDAKWLSAEYLDLKPADISPVRPLRFKARDGLELTGYLTLPQGRDRKALPLVVFPHGGPASRDTPGFDWWAQAMASRGYAVLQVNFRGSEGLGERLLEAGYGEWGRKMQTDLSDGVRFLAGEGTIDPKRVCVVGASYGGYAALAGAALDPDVYRCAVSVAGPSDLRRFIEWARGRNGQAAYRYWTRFVGAEDSRDARLAEISPAAHVNAVKAPVLLIHGKDDTVVPLEQSRIMADALQRAGKPVELVVQPGADHWLSRGDTRLQMLRATVAFLEKHNPPN